MHDFLIFVLHLFKVGHDERLFSDSIALSSILFTVLLLFGIYLTVLEFGKSNCQLMNSFSKLI